MKIYIIKKSFSYEFYKIKCANVFEMRL